MSHRLARVLLSVSLLVCMYCAGLLLPGCAVVRHELQLAEPEPEPPNMNAVLATISRFGMCHACPIANDLALTAAHCVDPRPFSPEVPAYGARYSNGDGTVSGVANPLAVSAREDVAVVELVPPVGGFYIRATEEPEPGVMHWWMGYDYRNRKNALKPRRWYGRVVTIRAGTMVLEEKAEEGASGGCLISERGELDAVVNWRVGVGVNESVAIGSGVWGTWADELIKAARDKQAERNKPKLPVVDLLQVLEDEERKQQ